MADKYWFKEQYRIKQVGDEFKRVPYFAIYTMANQWDDMEDFVEMAPSKVKEVSTFKLAESYVRLMNEETK